MASGPPEDDAPVNGMVAALINEYFDRCQAGEDLDPQRFAAEHPEVADELRPYLEGLTLIDQARSAVSGEYRAAPPTADAALPAISGYELLEEIGRGGMGVAYKARQVATKRVVAVKVMLAGPFASEAGRRRFAREVELAARLDHPGVVRVLESGTVAGQPYYAMDYVAGVSLARYLTEAARSVRRILELFVQICDTVEGAHQCGVVHRDLKPANVLVDQEGKPHILDFGLAKAVDLSGGHPASYYTTLSSPGQVMGTLAYLSPEQAAGTPAQVDARTDVYALGVMLFEALTGQLPIDPKGRPSEVLQRILECLPTPPSRLSPRVDDELETIVLKALAKQKQHRYACARELCEDLRRYLTGEPVLARRPSHFYFMCKKLRKHRLRIGLGAVVLVIVIVAALGGMWWSQQRRAQREAAELAAARSNALRAQQQMELGDIEAGRTAAHAVRSAYPSLPDAVLVGAQALFRDRKTELASVDLERQHEGAPAYWPSRALLAEICRSRGDPARAEQLAAEATRLMPDSAEGWYLRSLATLNLAAAAEFARRAISRDPMHLLALSRLARLRVQLGQLDGALEVVQQLVRLQPDDLDSLLLEGEILVRRHDFEQAVTVYTEVMRAHPECVGAQLFRAQAYRRLKRFDEALADYDALLAPEKVQPGTVPIWHRYQRAAVLWMVGRAAEAVTDYQRVRAVVGRPHYADARRAVILHELGRHEEATAVLEEAQRAADDRWLAQIFACLGGRISPEALARAAEAMAPPSPTVLARACEAFYYAGEACLLKGERDQARAWFHRCVQTGVEFDPQVFLPTPMNEYELAEWRLETLPAPETAPAGN